MLFWQGKKVFLTGLTGFKGSWLSIWLQELGAVVTGYSLDPPTSPSLFELARVADGMNDIHGDVRDLEALKTALTASQAEIVIHMAAQSLVRDSYKFPLETYSTNVMGTVNILEAARLQENVRAVLNVTSDKCYENREWTRGYREDDPMGGHDPY
ncbi:MAG: GDP-mannose 4,6-dehydratase, partial [Desulfobulbales bacterium]